MWIFPWGCCRNGGCEQGKDAGAGVAMRIPVLGRVSFLPASVLLVKLLQLQSDVVVVALTDPNASAAQQAVLQQHLNSLTYSPFGDSPLFRNPMSDPKKKEEVSAPTTRPILWVGFEMTSYFVLAPFT